MEERSFKNEAYRYGFNGKENDTDWGSDMIQDYGFRIYMPVIGKFLSVDPLTASYPWYTPYQFAGNKPIYAVDLDGLEEFRATTGELIYKHSDNGVTYIVNDDYLKLQVESYILISQIKGVNSNGKIEVDYQFMLDNWDYAPPKFGI